MNVRTCSFAFAALLTALPLLRAQADVAAPQDLAQCVAMLKDGPAGAREAAIAAAPTFGAAAVPAIGALLVEPAGQDEAATMRATAAQRALWRLAEAATAQDANARATLAKAMLDLAEHEPALPAVPAGEVLRMIGLVAVDDAAVQRLATHLDRPDHRDAALGALQTVAGKAGDRVLLDRLAAPGGVPRVRIVQAIGARRIGAAAIHLAKLQAQASADELPAIRRALAETGEPCAGAELQNAVARNEPGAAADWLLWHDRAVAKGGSVAGLQPYWRRLLRNEAADARAAAVHALAGSAEDLPALIAALGDADRAVRAEARAALAAAPDADAALLAAHGTAAPAVRGGLLLALADRRHARAHELARADGKHAEPAVRAAAVEVLAAAGQAADEDALFAAAADADATVRATAARGLSDCARRREQQGDRDGALRLLHRILAAGGDVELLRAAIARTGKIASPASLAALEPLAADARFRETALDARLQIAKALPDAGREQAITILQATFAASRDRARRASALAQLRRRGVDTAPLVQAGGFLQDWHVLGPWTKAKGKDELAQQPFGAKAPDTAAAVANGGAELRWQARHGDDPDGLVDLGFLRPRDNVSAFATCTFTVAADVDATLALGSDDAVAVWLDGALVHANWVARGVNVDEDKVKVRLGAGTHVLLVRVDQGGGDFGFCLRFLGGDGAPLRFPAGR